MDKIRDWINKWITIFVQNTGGLWLIDWYRRQRILTQARKEMRNKNNDVGAAESMFYLNRIAKYFSNNRIYILKNHLIRVLFQKGFCKKVEKSEQVLECWHTYEFNIGEDDYCPKCGNSGVFKRHMLFRFYFEIDGSTYTWHQPESLVNWPVKEGGIGGVYQARERGDLVIDREKINLCSAMVYVWLRWNGVKSKDLPGIPGFWAAFRHDWKWMVRIFKKKLREARQKKTSDENPDWVPF